MNIDKASTSLLFDIFFVRDNLNLFIDSITIINKRNTIYIDYIELKSKLEEEEEENTIG